MELELLAFGLITGFTSGFFGIGGGSILIPMLLVAGFAMKEAVAISIMQMVLRQKCAETVSVVWQNMCMITV